MDECDSFLTSAGLRLTLVRSSTPHFLYVGGRPFVSYPLVSTPVAYYSTKAGTLVFRKGAPWTWQGEPVRQVAPVRVEQWRTKENMARLQRGRQLPCTVCGGSGGMHGPGMLHSHTPPDVELV